MTAHDLHSTLDDHPLTTLQAMQATMSENFRRAYGRGEHDRADDISHDIGIIQAEVMMRTARFAHNAGQPWTQAEDNRLQRLARSGETIDCIASALGRTCPGIAARGERFGLAFGDDGRVTHQSKSAVRS